jgi:hypothetical protein
MTARVGCRVRGISCPLDHSVEQTGTESRSEGDYRLEKKLSTFFPNAMWSMKRCQ